MADIKTPENDYAKNTMQQKWTTKRAQENHSREPPGSIRNTLRPLTTRPPSCSPCPDSHCRNCCGNTSTALSRFWSAPIQMCTPSARHSAYTRTASGAGVPLVALSGCNAASSTPGGTCAACERGAPDTSSCAISAESSATARSDILDAPTAGNTSEAGCGASGSDESACTSPARWPLAARSAPAKNVAASTGAIGTPTDCAGAIGACIAGLATTATAFTTAVESAPACTAAAAALCSLLFALCTSVDGLLATGLNQSTMPACCACSMARCHARSLAALDGVDGAACSRGAPAVAGAALFQSKARFMAYLRARMNWYAAPWPGATASPGLLRWPGAALRHGRIQPARQCDALLSHPLRAAASDSVPAAWRALRAIPARTVRRRGYAPAHAPATARPGHDGRHQSARTLPRPPAGFAAPCFRVTRRAPAGTYRSAAGYCPAAHATHPVANGAGRGSVPAHSRMRANQHSWDQLSG